MYYQQGDVILKRISSIPKDAKKRPGRAVLAEGEQTGHAHVAVATSQEIDVSLFERDGVLYLRSTGPAEIEHEEHDRFQIPAGAYQIGKVQEYDHFTEEARDVQD